MQTTNVARWFLLFLLLGTGASLAATASDFTARTLDGKPVHLTDLLKTGPVALDFWSAACKPCLEAMPKLAEIYQKYQDRGLTIVGINEDGPRNQHRVRPFLNRLKIPYPVVIDLDGSMMRQLQVPACPTLLLIAQDREIVLQQVGYKPGQEKALVEALEDLLSKPEKQKKE